MEFWDREREMDYLKSYLSKESNAILFVYGPKSSGKSTLMMRVIDEMKGFVYPYYYDLRLVPVSSYSDVLTIFFRERGWRQRLKEAIPGIASSFVRYFEVEGEVLKEILRRELNPFEVMESVLRGRVRKGKRVVIVFDEIQKLKEVYMNGGRRQRSLVNELFNFFVRITKVEHLAHVVVMTSDTFLIEEIYGSSALKNTSEFYLVDYFDDETAREILVERGKLSEEDAEYVVSWIGGVPWMMERIVSNGDVKERIKDLYEQVKARLFGYIDEKKMKKEDVKLTLKVLERVLDGVFPESGEELLEVRKLVGVEVLFYDPLKRKLRFQTKLDEKAAKELIGWGSEGNS